MKPVAKTKGERKGTRTGRCKGGVVLAGPMRDGREVPGRWTSAFLIECRRVYCRRFCPSCSPARSSPHPTAFSARPFSPPTKATAFGPCPSPPTPHRLPFLSSYTASLLAELDVPPSLFFSSALLSRPCSSHQQLSLSLPSSLPSPQRPSRSRSAPLPATSLTLPKQS